MTDPQPEPQLGSLCMVCGEDGTCAECAAAGLPPPPPDPYGTTPMEITP